MDLRDQEDIVRRAREGEMITKIAEKYGQYDYWEIYMAVYGSGERSSRGVKTMISNRLKKLETVTDKAEKQQLISETSDLVWHLYTRYQDNQKKLQQIRNVLQK